MAKKKTKKPNKTISATAMRSLGFVQKPIFQDSKTLMWEGPKGSVTGNGFVISFRELPTVQQFWATTRVLYANEGKYKLQNKVREGMAIIFHALDLKH